MGIKILCGGSFILLSYIPPSHEVSPRLEAAAATAGEGGDGLALEPTTVPELDPSVGSSKPWSTRSQINPPWALNVVRSRVLSAIWKNIELR